jgi:hypothetical protein
MGPAECEVAASAFADLSAWAGISWRAVCAARYQPANRSSVLADIKLMADRLEEVRAQLDIPELPSVAPTGTGWVERRG